MHLPPSILFRLVARCQSRMLKISWYLFTEVASPRRLQSRVRQGLTISVGCPPRKVVSAAGYPAAF